MHTPPIIIAGGGIAGLASALAVGGHDALILEQSQTFSEIGAGLQLGPNAVRALQKLGAWDAVQPITSSPPEIHMWDGVSGKRFKRLPLGADFENRFGAPYRAAHRADLHAALLSVVKTKPNIRIRLNEKISNVETHLADVSLKANDKPLTCQALIATDGVRSNIRQSMFANTIAIEAGAEHHRALLMLPEISGVAMDCVNLWMYPQGHVVHYPVGKQQRINLVAVTPKNIHPSQHFDKATPSLKNILELAKALFTPWPALYAPQLSSWTKGSLLLLGDAAHGTLPYLAQGAAMALEDAACLAAVLPTTQNFRHAFAETAQRRMARTQQLHRETLQAGRLYHLSRTLAHARNTAFTITPPELIARRLDWLYRG
jgi:salicylate hydroxylase